MEIKKGKIIVSKNGPYLVSGKLPLEKEIIEVDEELFPYKWGQSKKYPDQEAYSLCRCGNSKNKPYCDGSHIASNFDGTETDSRKKYLERVDLEMEGPEIKLTDVECFCARARFCERKEGTWDLTEKSADPIAKKLALEQAGNCPSGRLVIWDKKTKKAHEPKFKESLSITEDPGAKVNGPIWVKGGVQIESADGYQYEIRNRVTLCRCGQSANKPFCDGKHMQTHFDDGDESLK